MHSICRGYFDILLTVHLNIFISINQFDALNFIISLFQASTCFEHHVLIVRRAKIVLYSLWYHHTYRCDDTNILNIKITSISRVHLVGSYCTAHKILNSTKLL